MNRTALFLFSLTSLSAACGMAVAPDEDLAWAASPVESSISLQSQDPMPVSRGSFGPTVHDHEDELGLVRWHHGVAAGLKQAKALDKPLFLLFQEIPG